MIRLEDRRGMGRFGEKDSFIYNNKIPSISVLWARVPPYHHFEK